MHTDADERRWKRSIARAHVWAAHLRANTQSYSVGDKGSAQILCLSRELLRTMQVVVVLSVCLEYVSEAHRVAQREASAPQPLAFLKSSCLMRKEAGLHSRAWLKPGEWVSGLTQRPRQSLRNG